MNNAINTTNAQTLRQFRALASKALSFGGRNFKSKATIYENDNNTINVHYVAARKRRGEFFPSKVVVSVAYDSGSDMYNVEAVHVDGETMDSASIYRAEGVFFDHFSDVAEFVKRG